jgi:HK97 gp10 family phage protein
MPAPIVKFKLDGLRETQKAIGAFENRFRKKITRRAVDRAGMIVNKAAVAKCPVRIAIYRATTPLLEVGTLKKSIGRKRKAYRNSGIYVNVIGPRRGFRQVIGISSKGALIYEDPVNIAHLVEFGHGGPRPAPPHSFMRAAWDATRSQCQAAMVSVLSAGVAEAARG